MTTENARLSLNQRTTRRWSVDEAVAGCLRARIPAIGLWREEVAATGLAKSARIVRDAGLRVSSLCRGGFLTEVDNRAALDDNRRAIDEAAELGAACLVLVVGGLPDGSRDLPGARARMTDAIARLAPLAGAAGVPLALEPLHPVFCADRAVLSTLAQARGIAEQFPREQVGVVVDTFHLWWDPEVVTQIQASAGRILSFQLADWCVPLPPDVLLARAIPGDGPIDFVPLMNAVDNAGYRGDIEVEVFNQQVWDSDPDDVVTKIVSRFRGLRAALP